MPMTAIHTMQSIVLNQSGKMISDLRSLPGSAQRRLAPAPVDQLRCKKKMSYQHAPYLTPHQPASVARRNARERNRVKQVNNGFAALRQHIPSAVSAALSGGRVASRKLSKVDTLRLAVEYIKSLKRLLDESDESGTHLGHGPIVNHEPHTPPSSEASQSPAPSVLSDGSSGHNYAPEPYESYEPMSPEDEELLDVISWWQQQ